jgi:hypothetical protein
MEAQDSWPVEFTLAELWMLNDVIRHDEDAISKKAWPSVSTQLNGEIALAILACEDSDLKAYTLMLTKGDILVMDANVRRDMKTPEGAAGKAILLKLFKARYKLTYGAIVEGGEDLTYRQALDRKNFEPKEVEDAEPSNGPDDDPDENSIAV